MQIVRHSQIAMTMEVCSEVPTARTRSALRQLGKKLDGGVAVVRCCTDGKSGWSLIRELAADLGGAEGIRTPDPLDANPA
jgi:hypothetical protein